VTADLNGDLPSLDARFDYVLLADVLEHLQHPERVVAWTLRYLKPDGRLLISVPNVAHLYVRWKLLWGAFDYQDRGILDRTHLRFFTRKTFAAFIEDCGLACLEMHTTPAPVELVAPLFGRAGALHAAFARWLPGLLAYQFVCVAVNKHGR
jgi:SAM-dependent methyltransferase